ncbi:MAG: DUF4058 family protein [Oscillatoriales cyanobacterium]|nr:MAG: DUF4058 family protein [Oscillatoriales cyanobacterium]TAH20046.1 MAG: DUF4058 family protein [Oscillatoriales cyanobacterium]
MPSPFPGVDPYLENSEFWPEVHHRLITAIADAIGPALRPKYRVAIEKRIYLSDAADSDFLAIPDVTKFSKPSTGGQSTATATLLHPEPITVTVPILEEAREGYLELREVGTNRVITVIEILSPKNKRSGKGSSATDYVTDLTDRIKREVCKQCPMPNARCPMPHAPFPNYQGFPMSVKAAQ